MYVVYFNVNYFGERPLWMVNAITHYPTFTLHKSESVWMVPGTVGVDD